MKINSMKLLVIIILSLMVSGVAAGLFFIEIPTGNREAALMVLGALVSTLVNAISDFLRKKEV